MSIRPWRDIERRRSRQIMVGSVPVGGDAPISVQTMTNTPTEDAKATIDQIRRCEEAGADIIRVSCPTAEATAALKDIVREARVPIVADIHFNYKRALEAADAGAACLRINPGNIGSESRVQEVISAAKANGCAIRIGVNAGSLEKDLLEKYGEPCPEALVESALDHIRILEDHDFREYKVAVKASDVFLAVAAYQQLAGQVDCPLHLGVTEAGGLIGGTVKSALGIGSLLWAGIGDTIRVSLSAEPEEEVRVGYEILKSLGIRSRGVRVVSCPSCARQGFDVIRTVEALEGPWLRRERPRRSARDRYRHHRRRPGQAHGLSVGRHRSSCPRRGDDRPYREAGRGEGRRDRSGAGPAHVRRGRVAVNLFSARPGASLRRGQVDRHPDLERSACGRAEALRAAAPD
jgi:(E)-4-hydroxy-3-methylbut-2-enyl-diphosphate synthase